MSAILNTIAKVAIPIGAAASFLQYSMYDGKGLTTPESELDLRTVRTPPSNNRRSRTALYIQQQSTVANLGSRDQPFLSFRVLLVWENLFSSGRV